MNTDAPPLVSVDQQRCREILGVFKGNTRWNQMDDGESDPPYVGADSKKTTPGELFPVGVWIVWRGHSIVHHALIKLNGLMN